MDNLHNLHTHWARLLIHSIAGAGVRRVVISPGSRSTPLALAALAETRVGTFVIPDERSAAFFALGQARLDGVPTALVCTSGTAPAHYFPAVIEANMAGIPLLVISADRPWEDYDRGANQTVDQVKLFGDHVKKYYELGLPDPDPQAICAVQRIGVLAVHTATDGPRGPVHVNARFRKPLEPVPEDAYSPAAALVAHLMEAGPPVVVAPRSAVAPLDLQELASAIEGAKSGIIVCGPSGGGQDPAALRGGVRALAAHTGFPIFAESASQVRFGEDAGCVCENFDALLSIPSFREGLKPDVIIEVNGALVSAAYHRFVADRTFGSRYIICGDRWKDPSGFATGMLLTDPVETMDALVRMPAPTSSSAIDAFAASVTGADEQAGAAIAEQRDAGDFSGGQVAAFLAGHLPDNAVLMLGNSLPIRDMDTSGPSTCRPSVVLHQRGASGIDGMLSGAAGAASVTDRPVVLLVGDTAARHDLTGLEVLGKSASTVVVLVVNNDGGRIFEQLPIGEQPDLYDALEQAFVVPGGATLEHAAAMYDCRYALATDKRALGEAFDRAVTYKGTTVLEAVVKDRDRLENRRHLLASIEERLSP